MDSFNRLWIYNPNLPSFHCYNTTNYKEIQIPANKETKDCTITQIMDDEDGVIWIATNAGIYKVNGFNFQTEHIQKDATSTSSLTSNHICSLYKDDAGIIWIGTGREGVCYQQLNKLTFKTYPINTEEDITCIFQDYHNNIWLGTDGKGLIKWNFGKGTTVYNNTNCNLGSNFIIS